MQSPPAAGVQNSRGGGGSRRRRQVRCHLCERVFAKNEHLSRHIISHTKEKPFSCDVCQRHYSRYDSLIRHARVHSHRRSHSQDTENDRQSGQGGLRRQRRPYQSSPNDGQPVVERSPPSSNGGITGGELGESGNAASAISLGGLPDGRRGGKHSRSQYRPLAMSNFNDTAGIDSVGIAAPQPGTEDLHTNLPDIGFWDREAELDQPLWLLGEEFDVSALNASIEATLSQSNTQQNPNSLTGSMDIYGPAANMHHQRPPPPPPSPPDISYPLVSSLTQEIWHTRPGPVPPVNHHTGTGQPQDQEEVDETYRANLSRRLNPKFHGGMLPSTRFLNLCIKLFFTKFNPAFPLIHAPSFRPSSDNSLLVLSICSIGALFVGTTSATAHGREIFLRLNKAILASWETYLYRSGRESLSIAQAVVLGQTFGMLSGYSSDLLLAHSFHGTIIVWARQVGMFSIKDTERQKQQCNQSEDLDTAWQNWARAEEKIRVVMCLHAHDSEFTTLFHTDPFLRPDNEKLPRCCSDETFSASTAVRWKATLEQSGDSTQQSSPSQQSLPLAEQSPIPSQLYFYVRLSGIIAAICEARNYPRGRPSSSEFGEQLESWWQSRSAIFDSSSKDDPICLNALWHEAFICLYADTDLLEYVIGRDGPVAQGGRVADAAAWAASPEARKCILHAALVVKCLEGRNVKIDPALHVPKTLFHAGLVIYCYIKFAPPTAAATSEAEWDIRELSHLPGFTSRRACSALFQSVDFSTLCGVVDLLKRICHWGLARTFSSILEILVDDLVSLGI